MAAIASAAPIEGKKPEYLQEAAASFANDEAVGRRMWAPGLDEGYMPQGLAVTGGHILVSAYRDPDVLGAGGWIIPAWQLGMPAWFPEEFLWVVGCSYRGLPMHVTIILTGLVKRLGG